MNKGQIIILLLIIALGFYFLSEEKPQPKKPFLPKSNQSTKLTWPKLQIKAHEEPTEIKWIEAPSKLTSPANFRVNPPHSQLNEPQNEPRTPQSTEPTINPSPKSEPASELTSEEQLQRKEQELSDYHWLLNNKTISDWHHEQKLTTAQYQVLRTLISEEEMNTLDYFLNLLPANYEWTFLHAEFKDPTLIEHWKEHFTYHQTQDWLKIGVKPTDYALVAWLVNTKKLTAEEVLNFADFEQLKAEFAHYGN